MIFDKTQISQSLYFILIKTSFYGEVQLFNRCFVTEVSLFNGSLYSSVASVIQLTDNQLGYELVDGHRFFLAEFQYLF